MRGFLFRALAPVAVVLLGSPLLVRRFDRGSGSRDFDDALPSAPAPRPGPPAFRRVTPEREATREPAAERQPEPDPREPPLMPRSASATSPRSADWMEELRRSIRQPEPTPAARSVPGVADRPGRRRISLGRDAAITLGLLAIAALVGVGMTAFIVGDAGASATPTGNAAASLDSPAPSVTPGAEVSPTTAASPSAAVTPSPPSATASPPPTPALPEPAVALAGSHTDGVPHIEVIWPDVDAATGYELAFDRNDGEWEKIRLDPTTATSRTMRIAPDRSYRFRVRAEVDGELGQWATSDPFRITTLDGDAEAVAYDGAWQPAFHDAYVGSDVQFAGAAGASATLIFDGIGVAWRGPLGPGRGRAEVFVDGQSEGRIDAGAGTFSAQNVLFARSFEESGEHELRIEVEGTTGRPVVAIDAFYVLAN